MNIGLLKKREKFNKKAGRWLSEHNPRLLEFLEIDLGEIMTEPASMRRAVGLLGAAGGLVALPAYKFIETIAEGYTVPQAAVSATTVFLMANLTGGTAVTMLASSATGYGVGANIDRKLGLYKESQESLFGAMYEGLQAIQVRYRIKSEFAIEGFNTRYHRIANREMTLKEALFGEIPRIPLRSGDESF